MPNTSFPRKTLHVAKLFRVPALLSICPPDRPRFIKSPASDHKFPSFRWLHTSGNNDQLRMEIPNCGNPEVHTAIHTPRSSITWNFGSQHPGAPILEICHRSSKTVSSSKSVTDPRNPLQILEIYPRSLKSYPDSRNPSQILVICPRSSKSAYLSFPTAYLSFPTACISFPTACLSFPTARISPSSSFLSLLIFPNRHRSSPTMAPLPQLMLNCLPPLPQLPEIRPSSSESVPHPRNPSQILEICRNSRP